MTRFLSTPDVARIVHSLTLPEFLRRLVTQLESDYLRWGEFDKTPRSAAHSKDGVIELMPIADAARYSFKYVNGHPKNHRFGLPTVMAFGVLADVATGAPLLLSELTLTTALQVLFARLPLLLPALGNALSLGLYALAFAFLFHYLPDRRVRWRQAMLGGAITAALFVAGRWAIGLYLAQAAPGSAYGSMGTLVLLLVWMYYAAAVFFGGALITAVIDERMAERAAHARTD